MHTIQKKTDIKINRNSQVLISLILAAFSITLSGVILSNLRGISPFNLLDIFFKLIMTTTLVGIIYSFNDAIDNTDRKIVNRNYTRPIIWSGLLLLNFIFMWISDIVLIHSLIICFIILFIGIIYSLEFVHQDQLIKIKNIFIIKNVFIALGWALLIPLGHNSAPDMYIVVFTIFTFIQVFIGSIIRDLADMIEDKKFNVISIPVKLGEAKTLKLIFNINGLSALFVIISSLLMSNYQISILLLLVPSLFRALLIYKLKVETKNPLYLQTYNLAICGVIFLSQVLIL